MAITKNGTTRADKLTATAADTTLNGLDGNDTLSSASFAGASLYGGKGDDILIAKATDTLIHGGDGKDTVQFAAAVAAGDLFDEDLVSVENVVITSSLGLGYDFAAQTESLNISGGKGNDTITGGGAADTLSGGAGDDTLDVQATDALIDGGAGLDTVIFRAAVSVVNLTDKELINVEQVQIANESAATYDFSVQSEGLIISGSDAFDTVIGGKGIDTVQFAADVSGVYDSEFVGRELSDLELKNVEIVQIVNGGGISLNLSLQTESLQIIGGVGEDTISGGYRADTITGGWGEDTISGNDGADLIYADDADWIDGGVGDDTVSYAAGVSGLDNDALINVERIVITNTSNAAYDFGWQGDTVLEQLNISGGKANDTITGGQDADTLSGGAGNDLLIAQDSDTLIDGGAGTDTVRFDAAVSVANLTDKDLVAVERIEVNTDYDDSYDFSVQTEGLTIIGGDYDDAIKGAGKAANTIDGGWGDDRLTGGTANDNLSGGYGDDYLFGGAGNDNLSGGDGNDTLVGATGTGTSIDADILRGGDGADLLLAEDTDALIDGGSNASTGVYLEYDTVQFAKSVSAINLRDVDMVGVEKVQITNTVAGRYDFSVQSEALIIRGNSAADSIVGGKDWDWIWGGAGVDDLKGGLGADRFDFTSLSGDQDSMPGLVTDLIRDFSGDQTSQAMQGDKIVGLWGAADADNYVEATAPAASLAALLTAADDELNGIVKYYVGEFNGDSYLVTDKDGNGYTEVIRLVGVKLAGIQATDIVYGEGPRVGDTPNTSNLIFDFGAGDRNGDGVIDLQDRQTFESPYVYYAENDIDLDFDDMITTPDGNDAALVMIGDRVRGLTEVGDFIPGETALAVPATFDDYGDDLVDDTQFEVYYGTYVTQDGVKTFTVTSTPGTTADPTTATHTMILYDNDTSGNVGFVEGLVFDGVYAEEQWYISDGLTPNAKLNYDTDGVGVPSSDGFSYDHLDEENVIYGGIGEDILGGGNGIDVIYGAGGSDSISGGNDDDVLMGDDGNDTIYGGYGDDVMIGGSGDDSLEGYSGNDTLTGGAGNDTFNVNWGTDTITDLETGDSLILSGSPVEAIATGVTDFVATSSTNTGTAGNRAEIQAAASGATIDVSLATATNKGFELIGNVGDDSLTGSSNDDTITGGAGSDTFVFGGTRVPNAADTITDFATGVDVYDTDFSTTVGNFSFAAAAVSSIDVVGDVTLTNAMVSSGVLTYSVDLSGLTALQLTSSLSILDKVEDAMTGGAGIASNGNFSGVPNGIEFLWAITDSSTGDTYLIEASESDNDGIIMGGTESMLVGVFQGATLHTGDII